MGGPVCCGLIPHLELAHRPHLQGQAVVIGDWSRGVVTASEEAAFFGVRPGLPLRQAQHLCPQALILPPEPEASERLRRLLSAALYDVAPVVEVRREGIAWLDLEGVAKRGDAIREARRRLRSATQSDPRLGYAPGPFSARLAAKQASPGRLVKVEDARTFLAPFPVAELELEPEPHERLKLLGLRTLRDVAGIGPRQLESQIGRAARLAVARARGAEPDRLQAWQPPACPHAYRQFEPPVEDREALLFVSRALAEELAQEFGLRGAGARRIRVRLNVETGEPEVREALVRHPLSSSVEIFGLVSSWIRDWQPGSPVTELRLEVPELERAGQRQLRLWVGGDGSAEEVAAAIERLQDRFGEEVVARPRAALTTSPIPQQRFEWASA